MTVEDLTCMFELIELYDRYDVAGFIMDNKSKLIRLTKNNSQYDRYQKRKNQFTSASNSPSPVRYIFPIKQKGITNVGRLSEKCQLVSNKPTTTLVHFRVWCIRFNINSPPFVYIQDLSRNGCFINNVKLGLRNIRPLKNNDVIEIKQGLVCRFIYSPDGGVYHSPDELEKVVYNPSSEKEWRVTNQCIGRGSFGSVHIGFEDKFNKCVAVKIIKNRHGSSSKKFKFISEANILVNVQHVCITP